ncbi:hypothetical protein HD553DRAFT_326740 [Filobasidium floriforme]|uniref:uncharacterized protein n=1 Tax=Filobasidium floriforme TaxID=5210 RepID=UPI001E8D6BF9|nr:uncharacterized protein HD553DRAFT_326740 [Filobasidium floriforme]KAH8079042.1 hypothetical protein HD553DRAFT_326740 [Filobasidium floriforme]
MSKCPYYADSQATDILRAQGSQVSLPPPNSQRLPPPSTLPGFMAPSLQMHPSSSQVPPPHITPMSRGPFDRSAPVLQSGNFNYGGFPSMFSNATPSSSSFPGVAPASQNGYYQSQYNNSAKGPLCFLVPVVLFFDVTSLIILGCVVYSILCSSVLLATSQVVYLCLNNGVDNSSDVMSRQMNPYRCRHDEANEQTILDVDSFVLRFHHDVKPLEVPPRPNNNSNNNNNNNNMPANPNAAANAAAAAAAPPVPYALTKRVPTEEEDALDAPTEADELLPVNFDVDQIIELVEDLDEPDLKIFNPRCGTVNDWWRKICAAQDKWRAAEADERGQFPAAKIGDDWKAIRATTGAFIVPPSGAKLAAINFDAELHKALIKEEERKWLPAVPPADFIELLAPSRTGGMDEQAVNGWLQRWRGGWRIACGHCKAKYSSATVPLPAYQFQNDDARQYVLPANASPAAIDANPLALCVKYGTLEICRSTVPLVSSSAFSACGRCKSLGKTCNEAAGATFDWDKDIDEDSPAVLSVAKVLRDFALGRKQLVVERNSAAAHGLEILRDGVCHGNTEAMVAVEGVAQPHEGQDEETTRILTELIDEVKNAGKKGKGKARAANN